MGREVRQVPENWEHPKNENGNCIPLHGYSFTERLAEWEKGRNKWDKGLRGDFSGGWKPKEKDELNITYEEWDGEKPQKEDYMPEWDKSELTHIMMYENTSEGTPISPAFKTPEELARWLTDNGASAFANMTATYEDWLKTINVGYAFSMIHDEKGLRSGVSA